MRYGVFTDVNSNGRVVAIALYAEDEVEYFFDLRNRAELLILSRLLKSESNQFIFYDSMPALVFFKKELNILIYPRGDISLLTRLDITKNVYDKGNDKTKFAKLIKDVAGHAPDVSTKGAWDTLSLIDVDEVDDYKINLIKFAQLVLEMEAYILRDFPSKLSYNVELAIVPAILKMHVHGMLLDRDKWNGIVLDLEQKIGAIYADLSMRVDTKFNPLSSKEIEKILVNKLQIAGDLPKTSKGKISISKHALSMIDNPWVKDLIGLRELIQILHTANGYRDYIDMSKAISIIHPEFKSVSDTGLARITPYEPAINLLPSVLRKTILPDRGMQYLYIKWVSADILILAFKANDKDLITQYYNGTDSYSHIAQRLFNASGRSLELSELAMTKAILSYYIYGTPTMIDSDVPVMSDKDIKAMTGAFLDLFPAIAKYVEKLSFEVVSKGYVTSISGRRRVIDISKSDMQRSAIGSVVINGVADLFKIALSRLDIALSEPFRIVYGVYDGFLLQVPRNYDLSVLKSIFDRAFLFGSKKESTIKMRYVAHEGHDFSIVR